jgi:SAM-dependent methyltransferase
MSDDGLPARPPSLPPGLDRVAAAYQGAVARHGPTPSGVGWSSRQGQDMRLRVLIRLLAGETAPEVSVADIGCGYGALWPLLAGRTAPRVAAYTGYDIVPRMVRLGRAAHGRDPRVRFLLGQEPRERVDHAFVSGTFNFRETIPVAEWEERVRESLSSVAAACRRGLAFNLLHRRGSKSLRHMYYTTPEAWIGPARALARGGTVTVIDDYLPDDFTILVRFGTSR